MHGKALAIAAIQNDLPLHHRSTGDAQSSDDLIQARRFTSAEAKVCITVLTAAQQATQPVVALTRVLMPACRVLQLCSAAACKLLHRRFGCIIGLQLHLHHDSS
jgi:hypothetical protein